MLNCLLGVHDGPKVAMPGDRLVNGAGVSRRRRGQSTVSGFDRWHGRPNRRKAILGNPSLGNHATATAGSEYIGFVQ